MQGLELTIRCGNSFKPGLFDVKLTNLCCNESYRFLTNGRVVILLTSSLIDQRD
jgi:hypothetical protein